MKNLLKNNNWLLLLPSLSILITLILLPMVVLLDFSLSQRSIQGGVRLCFSLLAYKQILSNVVACAFVKSFILASLTSIFCLIIGLPLAIYINFFVKPKHKNMIIIFLTLPMWVSFLLRIYGWMNFLKHNGVLEHISNSFGYFDYHSILYSRLAVLLAMVYNYIPFMVLPLYSSVGKINISLIEAAYDLGSRPIDVLFKIIIPQAKSGIIIGLMMVFMPCLGDYVTPDLMGGSKELFIGNLIQNQFLVTRDWPFGSALSLSLIICIFLILYVLHRLKLFNDIV